MISHDLPCASEGHPSSPAPPPPPAALSAQVPYIFIAWTMSFADLSATPLLYSACAIVFDSMAMQSFFMMAACLAWCVVASDCFRLLLIAS